MNRSEILRHEKMFRLRGKEAIVARREARRAEELRVCESAKTSRIASRVIAALSGQDISTSWEVLSQEIKYLRRRSAIEIIIENN